MGKYLTRGLLLIAVIFWLVAWGRLVSAAATHTPPPQAFSYLPAGADADSALVCGKQVITTPDAIWRFPCTYHLADNDAQAVALVRFDMTNAGEHLAWALPDVTLPAGAVIEENPYRLFTFVPNTLSGHVVFGVTGQPDAGETAETAPVLYLARMDGGLVTLSAPPFADHEQLRGAAWIDELNLQMVYGDFYDEEVSMAALFGMGGDEEGGDGSDGGEGETADENSEPSQEDADTGEDSEEGETPEVVPTDEADAELEATEESPSDPDTDTEADESGEDTGEGEAAEGNGEGGEDGDGGGDDGGFFLPPLLMPRATLHIATLSGRTGEWSTREIADPACSDDFTACIPELAYYSADDWRVVYLRYPATVRNVTDVMAEIVEGTETEPPFKTGEVSLYDTTHCFMTGGFEDPLLRWFSKPLDFSRSNILFRAACLPLYRLNGDVWEGLALPQSDEGISYDIPAPNAYFYDPENGYLEALPVANTLRSQERLIYLDGRWVSLSVDAASESLILTDGDVSRQVVGAAGAEWLNLTNTPAAPDDEGGLWLLNERMAYARVDADFERVDSVGFDTRLNRMLSDNFRLMAGTESVYGDDNVLKRLAAPWLLAGLPISLLIAVLVWRSRRMSVPYIDSPPALAAALFYIATFAVFVAWFWMMTAVL